MLGVLTCNLVSISYYDGTVEGNRGPIKMEAAQWSKKHLHNNSAADKTKHKATLVELHILLCWWVSVKNAVHFLLRVNNSLYIVTDDLAN